MLLQKPHISGWGGWQQEGNLHSAATTNYAAVILTCRKLQAIPDLTPEQIAAVNGMTTVFSSQMTEAAQKGDPSALKAVEEIRRQWRSTGPGR